MTLPSVGRLQIGSGDLSVFNPIPVPTGAPVTATGATAGVPGSFTPSGATPPANLAAMTGIVASPASAWVAGQYVLLSDTSHAWWNGTAWAAGDAPGGRATGATAGIPGSFTPAGAATPANFTDLTAAPPITASPATAWTTGQYVALGDTTHAYWNGTAYAVGDAPAPSVPATGATAGTPGSFTPAGAITPANLAAMSGITASPATLWTVGQHVILADASHCYWTGSAWAAGNAPAPAATGATAGTPGTFTPAGAVAPANLAAMAGITASPATAWTTGQHVILGDASHCYWNATAWVAGNAPAVGGEWAAYGTVNGQYDFSNTATITHSAGAVSQVTAESGTYAPITQGTAGLKPTTGTRTKNGLNVLDFVGASSQRLLATITSEAQPFTFAVVCASDNLDSLTHTIMGDDAELYIDTDRWTLVGTSLLFAASPLEDANWHVLVGIFNGASSSLWLDGVQIASGTIGTMAHASVCIGAYRGGGYGFDGAIGEAVYFSGVVANPAGLSSAMGTKWGISTGFNPVSISGFAGWLDTSDATTVTASGSPLVVSALEGKGGIACHCWQDTVGAQAKYGTQIINGRNCFEFRAGAWMAASTNFLSGKTAGSMFYVARFVGTPYRPPYGYACGVGDEYEDLSGTTWDSFGRTDRATYPAPTTRLPGLHLWSKLAGPGDKRSYLDSTATFATTTNAVSFGAGGNLGASDVDFCEVVCYDRIVTEAERATIEDYLRTKWGTPAAGFNAASWGTVYGEYDFARPERVTASAGAVSSVGSSSGTWGAIAQATGTAQPTTGTITQNGLNVLDFDGTADVLDGALVNVVQPVTLVVVCKSDNLDSAQHTVSGTTAAGPTLFVNADVWQSYAGAVIGSSKAEDALWHVVLGIFNGASSSLWVDGVQVATGNPGAAGTDYYAVGASAHPSFRYFWNGAVAHAIYYNGVVANPAGLSAALKTRWGTV
jgi:hypothetical protein